MRGGHLVVSRWIWGGHREPGLEREMAEEDIQDLVKADTMIQFTGPVRQGGRHVEFGYAIGSSFINRLILIGERENVFHYLKNVEQYPDWESYCLAPKL